MTAAASSEPTPGRQSQPHIPVLLCEVLNALSPTDGATYIDATFGAGGYASALLEAAQCTVIALDRDPAAVAGGQRHVAAFAPRLQLHLAPFSAMAEVIAEHGCAPIDGVVFDLGVSSMQLDRPERGFSFLHDGPLNMRMSSPPAIEGLPGGATGQTQSGLSAADVINTFDEAELANILYELGEERRSRAIAKALVRRRAEKPFETTLDLADVIARVVGRHG
ncbi:MAG: 16S rRNA (cytosine(1402)-N(4))-methyltransferase RsmH, partial [Alphaproteobacteria bacterium]|nr:16S rRNA (cytosine(1402)-N(4))-methyltransferase RsmH [Alphaproteobacteria bacterium]